MEKPKMNIRAEQQYLIDPNTGEKKKFPQDFFDNKENEKPNEEKGWTILYIPWEDDKGKPRVAGRFRTIKEKDVFIEEIHKPDSGFTTEELSTVTSINDYNYMLPY